MEFPEPTRPRCSRADVLLDYLDFFRGTVAGKVGALGDGAGVSRVPSGWTPLELVGE